MWDNPIEGYTSYMAGDVLDILRKVLWKMTKAPTRTVFNVKLLIFCGNIPSDPKLGNGRG